MSNVDYNALLEAVKTKLGAIAPARIVTRTYQSFEHRAESDLQTALGHEGGKRRLRRMFCALRERKGQKNERRQKPHAAIVVDSSAIEVISLCYLKELPYDS